MSRRISLPGTVGSTGTPLAASGSTLPTEVLEVAARRLAILAAIYATVYFVAVFLLPTPPQWQADRYIAQQYVGSVVCIAIALIAAAVFRSGRLSSRQVVIAGFGLEIYGAIGIEWALLLWGGDPQFIELGLSWTAAWIIAFPLILPSPPLRTFIVATIAASIRPAILVTLAVQGVTLPDWATILQFVIPTYICVAIATIGAVVVYGLRRDVSRARQMGSYRLLEKLGQGGMGEVWTAEHRMLARTAALKLIHPRGESPIEIAQLQRFEREVQTTARLRSPHTIEIYDYGFTGDGTFYYVMELLAGLDLDDFLRKYGPMPDGRVIWILRQVCHSLGEAHELGLVHRDVKPANIFLCKAGRDFDVAKVLDFGLVKRTRDAFAEDEHLTVHGAFYGTPLYASPEMARGDVDLADARTDIYSLACVAYWLLTGRTVFAGDTPMAVLVKHTSAEPDPPSRHSAQQISTGLDDVILRCLAKEPAARPDADELLALLGKVEPLQEWDERRARDWWATTNPSVPSTTPSGPRPGEGTLVTPEGASR